MERLYFSIALQRRMYGQDNRGFPSEFLKSIGKDKLIESGYNIRSNVNPINKPTKPSTIKSTQKGLGFDVGDKIMHKIFGKGVVVKVEGSKITVAFGKEYGIKVLMADHPSITRI